MFLAREDRHEMSYVSALLGRLGMRRRTLVAALADRQTPPPAVRTARTGSYRASSREGSIRCGIADMPRAAGFRIIERNSPA
jgi:hypothetical protein